MFETIGRLSYLKFSFLHASLGAEYHPLFLLKFVAQSCHRATSSTFPALPYVYGASPAFARASAQYLDRPTAWRSARRSWPPVADAMARYGVSRCSRGVHFFVNGSSDAFFKGKATSMRRRSFVIVGYRVSFYTALAN